MYSERAVSQKQVWTGQNAFEKAQISGDKQQSVRPSMSLRMTICLAAALVKEDTHAKLSGITRQVDISRGGARRHEYE
jgi:hypothetical protein